MERGDQPRKALGDVIGKLRVVGGRETPLVPEAIFTSGPTERTFGGDVDFIGRIFFDHALEAAVGFDDQTDFGIEGHGHGGRKMRGAEDLHLMAPFFQFVREMLIGPHDPVNLGMPSV
jgi:hypothetical protein